jgi:hypothetical protein
VTFGRHLLRHGVVSRGALADATAAMVLFGGRLGTHLVARAALRLDVLERHLAAHQGAVLAPPERLEKPSPEALVALPEAAVRRHKVFPFGLAGGCLEVALRDPGDRALCTELARATGLRIAPFLTSELRLFLVLERHFGIRRQLRYALLAPEAALPPEELPILLLDEVIEDDPPAADDVSRGLASGEELIDAASFARLYERTDAPQAGSRPREGEWLVTSEASLAALEHGLAHARDRGAVVSHALAIALTHAKVAALFAVRGTAQGLAAAGEVACRDLRGVLVAPEPGSLLAAALERGAWVRGAPRPDGLDARLARLLRPAAPAEVAFFPIRIANRVVNVLYADNGLEPFAPGYCEALAGLCQRVSTSYSRIIVERKRRMC